MSPTEPSADTLDLPSSKHWTVPTKNLGVSVCSKGATEGQIGPSEEELSGRANDGQDKFHTPVDLDSEDHSPRRGEEDVPGMEGYDEFTELGYRTESFSLSPKPALSQADKVASLKAQGNGAPKASSYEGLENDAYLDPTPKTPRQETSPSRNPAIATETQDDGPKSELQSIMDQFDDGDRSTAEDEPDQLNSGPEKSHLRASVEHPPRRSSLEPLRPSSQQYSTHPALDLEARGQEDPTLDNENKSPPMRTSSLPKPAWLQDTSTPSSPNSSMSLPKVPPPEPDPEPSLPFDFHRFLEQLRHRTADPVAKFLRSFLIEFGKKQWMVHEQVKIINDFLTFITNKMAQCEIWRDVSDAEFDNAKEGMEKLVMNRLYSQTFSPAIPAPAPVQVTKGKRKIVERALSPGRKGQHQEDIERDEILAQKVRIYRWVQEEHLDIAPIGDSGKRFLMLAQQGEPSPLVLQLGLRPDLVTELLKIKTYRAPRDKVICVLNCCKVIFGKITVY